MQVTTSSAPEPSVPEDPPTREALDSLGGAKCFEESEFICVHIDVPIDHFAQGEGKTTKATFAVRPSSGERQGAVFVATGGPGTSGVAQADFLTGTIARLIPARYDMVFFDQRGIGFHNRLMCPYASERVGDSPVMTPFGFDRASLSDEARQFAQSCGSETGAPLIRPFIGTDQVIEDIEAFRAAMGYHKVVFWGQSYGTAVVQTYAHAYPERLERILLDGVIDLTLDGLDFAAEQGAGFNETLELVFEACRQDGRCVEDMGGDPGQVFDRLVAQSIKAPVEAQLPRPGGGSEVVSLNDGQITTLAGISMYAEGDRMLFLRALAAYGSRGDLVPLGQLYESGYILVGGTYQDYPMIEWSDAVYFGVWCLDYHFPGSTPEERAQRMFDFAEGRTLGLLPAFALAPLPCAYWPERSPHIDRPPPLVAERIPTLILSATADPATPHRQALSVLEWLADGHLISVSGGSHGVFGWGDQCVDRAVNGFLVAGRVPTHDTCDGSITTPYVPLMPLAVDDFVDLTELLVAIEDEVGHHPEFWMWGGHEDLVVDCRWGGTVTYRWVDEDLEYHLDGCHLMPTLSVSGVARLEWYADRIEMPEVAINGCVLAYSRRGSNAEVRGLCSPIPG